MFIGGLALVALGLILLVAYGFTRRKIATLTIARRRTAKELKDSAQALVQEIGSGGFRELVELVGEVRCGSPLTSPLGGQRCVHFAMDVTREYEEDYEEKDQQGNVHRRTRRGSESVASNTDSVEFTVGDESGEFPVEPRGADFDELTQSVSRFEQGQGGSTLSFGSFSLTLGLGGHGRRTLGYRYREHVLPLGRRVTLIGSVDDQEGRLALRKGGSHFIISTRTKAELLGSAKTTATVLQWLGGLALVGGVVVAVIGLFKG